MRTQDPTAERREEILGDVAEGLHRVFKETERRTMAAEDNDEFARLADTLSTLARGVRQCLAWHARLERERRAAEAEAAAGRAEAQAEALAARKARIGRAVGERMEAEWPEGDDLEANAAFNRRAAAFEERLERLSEDDGFLDRDPDALIARLCREFGMTPPEPAAARPTAPHPAGSAGGGPRPAGGVVEGAAAARGASSGLQSPDTS